MNDNFKILDSIYEYLVKRDSDDYENAGFEMRIRINNFIRINCNYKHLESIREIPEEFKKNKNNYQCLKRNNLIKKVIYQDDKYHNDNGMNTEDIVKNRNSEEELRITNTTENEQENHPKKQFSIGKSVSLNINFDGSTTEEGTVFLVGIRVANKYIYNLKQVKECMEKKMEDLYEDVNKNAKELVDINPVTELPNNNFNSNNEDNSGFKINLKTNSTLIPNGFWVYFVVLVKESNVKLISDGFSLISYRQFNKRQKEEKAKDKAEDKKQNKRQREEKDKNKEEKQLKKRRKDEKAENKAENKEKKLGESENKSFFEKQKLLMKSSQENLYAYYFETLFYLDKDRKYKMNNILDFRIKFYEESSTIQKNQRDDKMQPDSEKSIYNKSKSDLKTTVVNNENQYDFVTTINCSENI